MAGTLTISTLSDGTNSTSSTNCIQGSAKAWVNFNATGGVVAIRAQYNVSSVVRNATGDFTVNFTNAMTDANYSVAGIVGRSSGFGTVMDVYGAGTAPTASAVRVITSNVSTAADYAYNNVSIFR